MRITLVLLCAWLLLGAGDARAASGLRTGMADDGSLQYSGEDTARRAVDEWQRLGVDEARVQVRWVVVAARADGRTEPSGFDPRDPGDPRYDWGYTDQAVSLLRAAGIDPVLQITGSGPLWASTRPELGNPRYRPSPAAFADFVHAVVARYGDRVDRYSVWNEPNQALWLQPQYTCVRKRCTPASPDLYRSLFRAADAEIRRADPGADVLMGSLAPAGAVARTSISAMRPLAFIRRLGCVDARYRRVRTGACANAEPIRASAFAYHAHPVFKRPDQHSPDPDDAAIGDLGRLERALDRTTRVGVIGPDSGSRLMLDLSEFGYQTNPPDPYSGVSVAHQAAWLQWSWSLAARDPRVRAVSQYEWRDEPVKTTPSGRDFGGWQSGLRYADERPKPSLAIFPHPFFVDVRPGRRDAVFWGQVRPGGATDVRIRRGSRLVEVLRTNAAGMFTVRLPVTTRATYHYDYDVVEADGTSTVVRSGSQAVAPRRR